MTGKKLVEQATVLQCAVQTLSMERYDGVCRVADEQYPLAHVPRRTMHSAEDALAMGRELLFKVRHQSQRVRELAVEKCPRCDRFSQRLKAGRAGARHEQRGGKALVGVRQRDEHVSTPRPDMQGL